MSMNIGVVDWFTKTRKTINYPEDSNRELGFLIDSLKRAFFGKNLAMVADNVYVVLDKSDFYKDVCSNRRFPVCSIFNHSRSTSAIAVCLANDQLHSDRDFVRKSLEIYGLNADELRSYDSKADFIGLVRIAALLSDIGKIRSVEISGSGSSEYLKETNNIVLEILAESRDNALVEKYCLKKILPPLYHNLMNEKTSARFEQILHKAVLISSSSEQRYEVTWAVIGESITVQSDDSLFVHEIDWTGTDNLGREVPDISLIGNHAKVTHRINQPAEKNLSTLFYDRVSKCSPEKTMRTPDSVSGEIGYLALDIMQIQGYVTEADKLPMLRGGSRIVDDILDNAKKKIGADLCKEAILFSGGGNLLSFIPVTPEVQISMRDSIERIVENESVGVLKAAIITGKVSLNSLAGNFSEVMKEIQEYLEKEKQKPKDAPVIRVVEHSDLCPACKKRPVNGQLKTESGPETLCVPCARKREHGRSERVNSFLPADIMKEHGLNMPTELQHIGEAIAVLAVDGNMMGRIFQNTLTPADYTYKSETFDRRFKKVLNGTIREFVEEDLKRNTLKTSLVIHQVKDPSGGITKYLGINPVYIGGDDLLLIMNARGAVLFCRNLVENIAKEFRFEHTLKAGNTIGNPTVTVSCGIAVADMKFPIYFLLEAARKMESAAKEEFRKRSATNEYNLINIPNGSIAFTAVTGAMPGDETNTFVLPKKGQFHDEDAEALDQIIQMLDLSLTGTDMEKRMVSTVITCGKSEEERLNVLKFHYAATMRKQDGTPENWLNTCELLATVLTEPRILQASQMLIPFVWHVSEEAS
ncbi:MAG: hypothetical protein A4E35_00826 [Methanoregula sp. PtaU1.Bin051]|nr:MAG: hypothetical protein A4E35_00826 [Methanoregula sp. PtaU1.Bin051]